MYRIYKITSDHVVDFAAEELKKYLRMMMPECGEIFIKYDPEAKDGFRLGIMSDFGIDTSEADDLALDDILHIDTDTTGGIIAGSNPRSVLLSVYRYLRENGCRWLFPGIDGELIPIRDIKPTKYHKMAECRYRGQCNEGAEFQQNMIDVIDFTPKTGMNVFMIEFDNPKAYYDVYYNHVHNAENYMPEPVSADTVKQWKRQCEAEISKRGLQLHDMGHGWTAEPFGISSTNGWAKELDNPIPEESRDLIAMLDGERKLFGGVALNTQFCMSNPKARTIVAKYITKYAKMHQNVDYLHVWLADGFHNHCECEECRKKIPSDWYVMLLNEIDERLFAENLDTRIVFICYTDTTWAPTMEKLANKKRFSFMLAAITRTYSTAVPKELPKMELRPFVLNDKDSFPTKVEEYIAHAKEWWKKNRCPSMVYEYHFWLHQYYDPGCMDFSKLIYDDIRGYRANGFDGLIEDGSQRSFFPNGFNFYVYAETLFDTSSDYEAMKRDYFTDAYGELADTVIEYLTEITNAFNMRYIMNGTSVLVSGGKLDGFFNPSQAKMARSVRDIVEKYAPIFERNRVNSCRARTVAMTLLIRHLEYCKGLSEVWTLKALGADPESVTALNRLCTEFGRHESEMKTYFDHYMCFSALNRVISTPKTFFETD